MMSKSRKISGKQPSLPRQPQFYGFLNYQIFLSRHSPKQETKVNPMFNMSPSPLVSPEHDQPHCCQNTVTDVASASSSCLRRAARNGWTSVGSKCLSGTEVLLSLTFPNTHTCKPATMAGNIFVLARGIPAGVWAVWSCWARTEVCGSHQHQPETAHPKRHCWLPW